MSRVVYRETINDFVLSIIDCGRSRVDLRGARDGKTDASGDAPELWETERVRYQRTGLYTVTPSGWKVETERVNC
jgi:hypothetical protein